LRTVHRRLRRHYFCFAGIVVGPTTSTQSCRLSPGVCVGTHRESGNSPLVWEESLLAHSGAPLQRLAEPQEPGGRTGHRCEVSFRFLVHLLVSHFLAGGSWLLHVRQLRLGGS
jgi:hypothetical protein